MARSTTGLPSASGAGPHVFPRSSALQHLVELVQVLFAVPVVLVSCADRGRLCFLASAGFHVGDMEGDDLPCGRVVAEGRPIIVEDVGTASEWSARYARGIGFYAGVPICDDDGNATCALSLLDIRSRRLDATDRERLTACAAVAAALIQSRRFAPPLEPSAAHVSGHLFDRGAIGIPNVASSWGFVDRSETAALRSEHEAVRTALVHSTELLSRVADWLASLRRVTMPSAPIEDLLRSLHEEILFLEARVVVLDPASGKLEPLAANVSGTTVPMDEIEAETGLAARERCRFRVQMDTPGVPDRWYVLLPLDGGDRGGIAGHLALYAHPGSPFSPQATERARRTARAIQSALEANRPGREPATSWPARQVPVLPEV